MSTLNLSDTTAKPDIKLVLTLTGGGAMTVTSVTRLAVSAGIDSPAVSLSTEFAADTLLPEILSVKAYDGNRLLFEGQIDSQKSTVSRDGVLAAIDARDAGAFLLDNQALPCVMLYAQLGTVFSRFAQPYGFGYYCARAAASIPMFTVRAGQSEWDALVNFSRRAYGVTPYIASSRVMFSRRSTGAALVISNSGDGLRFTSISHSFVPYSIVSKVYIRDDNGFYSLSVSNASAARTKTTRKRYVIPTTEYAGNVGLDANQRIRRSMFEYEQLVVTLPQVLDAPLGQEVEIRDALLRRFNLMIVGREVNVSPNGVVTKLTLKSSMYYD